jgi:hypothetical protein
VQAAIIGFVEVLAIEAVGAEERDAHFISMGKGDGHTKLEKCYSWRQPAAASPIGPGLASKRHMPQQPSNLTMHRAPESVWDRQDYEHSRARAVSILGFALIAAGTALVGMGYKSQLGSLRCCAGAVFPRRSTKLDEVNNAADASFPASDPPAFTSVVGKAAQPESTR